MIIIILLKTLFGLRNITTRDFKILTSYTFFNMEVVAPVGSPASELFCVKQTPRSGRAVFATTFIPADTPLFVSDDLNIHVLFREFRREVCGKCFAYDDGREWKIRNTKHGFVFCSENCAAEWLQDQGEVGLEAWEEVEKLIKNKQKDDEDMVDPDAPKPTKSEIRTAWNKAESVAPLILEARNGLGGKKARKAINMALSERVSADILGLLVSAVLVRAACAGVKTYPLAHQQSQCQRDVQLGLELPIDSRETSGDSTSATTPVTPMSTNSLPLNLLSAKHRANESDINMEPDNKDFQPLHLLHNNSTEMAMTNPTISINPRPWSSVQALASDSRPYKSHAELTSHIHTYHALLSILPLPLLPYVTAATLTTALSRDSHNSFGIRSLNDDGCEYFGYGVWPAASYFNHSCDPNVHKRREGRKWIFCARRDVDAGEELCISYLSGEERNMRRGQRLDRLKKFWGFECGCERCKL
jgi:hypothetical protein